MIGMAPTCYSYRVGKQEEYKEVGCSGAESGEKVENDVEKNSSDEFDG